MLPFWPQTRSCGCRSEEKPSLSMFAPARTTGTVKSIRMGGRTPRPRKGTHIVRPCGPLCPWPLIALLLIALPPQPQQTGVWFRRLVFPVPSCASPRAHTDQVLLLTDRSSSSGVPGWPSAPNVRPFSGHFWAIQAEKNMSTVLTPQTVEPPDSRSSVLEKIPADARAKIDRAVVEFNPLSTKISTRNIRSRAMVSASPPFTHMPAGFAAPPPNADSANS